jgi:uncharacterized protein YqeY
MGLGLSTFRTLKKNDMTSFIDALNVHNEKISEMTIQNQINFEMKQSMKSGDTASRDFLRVVMGEFGRVGKVLNDDQALKVIKKMHSNAVELGDDYEEKVLERWLPKTLDEIALTQLIGNIIADNEWTEMSDLGKIMQELKKTSGVDMKTASKFAREMIFQDKI